MFKAAAGPLVWLRPGPGKLALFGKSRACETRSVDSTPGSPSSTAGIVLMGFTQGLRPCKVCSAFGHIAINEISCSLFSKQDVNSPCFVSTAAWLMSPGAKTLGQEPQAGRHLLWLLLCTLTCPSHKLATNGNDLNIHSPK